MGIDSHYKECFIEPLELIKIICTPQELKGFYKGNIIKYRLRAGHKDNATADIQKALWYEEKLKEIESYQQENEEEIKRLFSQLG